MDRADHQKDLGFCMGLSIGSTTTTSPPPSPPQQHQEDQRHEDGDDQADDDDDSIDQNDTTAPKKARRSTISEALYGTDHHEPVQLDLLPNTPVLPFDPSSANGSSEADSPGRQMMVGCLRGFDVNRAPNNTNNNLIDQDQRNNNEDGAAVSSSPNSGSASSLQIDFCIYSGGGGNLKDGHHHDQLDRSRASSRGGSDEDENGSTRKKLRLSKEQSAFLEESFKEHNTLNPKQKLALAKQLNLRPRQVEVWFQNRRARTKLKQTEVDCEYLKRCCETLTEENRRLQKELQELRALKTSSPFYMQLPATTLTMCPSCERVATNNPTTDSSPSAATFINRPSRLASANYPFPQPTSTNTSIIPTSRDDHNNIHVKNIEN